MDEATIRGRISALVDEEHRLRARRLRGELDSAEEHERLKEVEESLDQCWDLLRRRAAARAAGMNPDSVGPRSTGEVEGYLQ